jgi:hypothetical protein
VSDECNKHGTVRAVVIPRPSGSAEEDAKKSVGNIFVSFTSPEGASRAKSVLSGRTYDGKSLIAVFFPETLFEQKVCLLSSDCPSLTLLSRSAAPSLTPSLALLLEQIYTLPANFSFDQLEVESYHDVE